MQYQACFFVNPNETYRNILQLKGFLNNSHLNFAAEYLNIDAFYLPEIEMVETDMNRLNFSSYLRLGNKLERFFSFIIKESKKYEIIAENLQIVDNKVTLGEIDFLIKDLKTDEIFHIELGGKLYLYNPNIIDETQRWIGPNQSDSMFDKLRKLKKSQFPLLYHHVSKKKLEEMGVEYSQIIQKICFKVRLFVPLIFKNTIFPYSEFHNIKGYYVNYNTFLNSEFRDYQYFMPEKQDWIVDPKFGEIWFSHEEIKQKIEKMLMKKQSPMLWIKKEKEIYETIFVVFWQ